MNSKKVSTMPIAKANGLINFKPIELISNQVNVIKAL